MGLADYVLIKPIPETERTLLRTLAPADVPALREWMHDRQLYRYWGKQPGKADKDPALLFKTFIKATKSFHWGIIERADEKAIGELWIYLIENHRMAKVAFCISPQYQGRGYATEALHGTEADGSKSPDSCKYCYQAGAFTFNGSMEEMIEFCVPHMANANPNMTADEARTMMKAFFPALKR